MTRTGTLWVDTRRNGWTDSLHNTESALVWRHGISKNTCMACTLVWEIDICCNVQTVCTPVLEYGILKNISACTPVWEYGILMNTSACTPVWECGILKNTSACTPVLERGILENSGVACTPVLQRGISENNVAACTWVRHSDICLVYDTSYIRLLRRDISRDMHTVCAQVWQNDSCYSGSHYPPWNGIPAQALPDISCILFQELANNTLVCSIFLVLVLFLDTLWVQVSPLPFLLEQGPVSEQLLVVQLEQLLKNRHRRHHDLLK